MILLLGPLLLVVLVIVAVQAKKRGLSGSNVALTVVVGVVCIVMALFGILAWGFSGFG